MSLQKKAHGNTNESASNSEKMQDSASQSKEKYEIPTRDKPSESKNEESKMSNSSQPHEKLTQEEQSEVQSASQKDQISSSQGQKKDIHEDYKFEIIELEEHEPIQSSQEDGEIVNIVQMFYPEKCRLGQRIGNKFLCNQQIYRRAHSDGKVIIIWVLHNIGGQEFLNQVNQEPHWVESQVFESKPGITWKLRLEPGVWPVKTIQQTPQGGQQVQVSQKSTRSKIDLVAVPTSDEAEQKKMNRRIEVKFSTFSSNGEPHSQKDWWREYEYIDDKIEETHIQYENFYQFPQPRSMKGNMISDQFCVQIEILGLVPKNRSQQKQQAPDSSSANEGTVDDNDAAKKPYDFKGLMNEGTTCYLNSVIQALFFIRPFRNAVYKMPTITTEKDTKKLEASIPFCLQRIFYNLQLGSSSFVRTHELLQAFGWNSQDINSQQDVNEFNCKLSDELDKQMQNTPVQGTFNRLFEGDVQDVIKCVKVDYESCRDDKFNTIQLRVRGNNNIEESVKSYIKEESLDGANQYQTDDYGKQDALKFVRFKKLPPVLQISLQRYEYDLNVQQIVKENLKFEFGDVLDLESLLPNPPKGKSEITDKEIVNKYHLHSILVHRGTANAGHYYAFIKPTLEDAWYEFNDSKVHEVDRDYAFGQGIGGNLSSFEFIRQTMFKESTGQLIERLRENFANAYMLIYVRETEREAIMSDKLTLDEQVPMELQMHFKTEELFKKQIEQDNDHWNYYGKVLLMSAETLQQAKWDGPFLSQRFKDERQPWKYRFEHDQMQHMAIQVHKMISVNEFIIMLKERLFPHDDNIELEDIWLYRIQNPKNQKSSSHFFYYMQRTVYNLEERYECPLFSARPSRTYQEWQQEQKDQTKWKKNMLHPVINRYIVINPEKLNPRTGKPYSIIHKMNEKEMKEHQAHYNLFIDYIRKTDMMQGQYYLQMYNSFCDAQYSFDEFPKIDKGKDAQSAAGQIVDLEAGSHSKMSDKASNKKEDEADSPQPPSIFGPIEEIRKSIKRYRDKFVFKYDKNLYEKQKQEFEQLMENKDNQMDLVKEETDKQNQHSLLYLTFVKICGQYNRMQMKGPLFCRTDRPVDLKAIQKVAGLSDQDLENFDLFIEPYSNQQLRNYFDQENRVGQFKPEHYQERGFLQIKKSLYDIFRVDPEKLSQVTMSEYVKPGVEGLCFCYFPNKFKRVGENGEEQVEQMQPEYQANKYSILINSLANRGYIKLCYLSDQDITKSSMNEMVLGYFQFYYHETYGQIVERIARICHDVGLDVLISSQQNLQNFIQLFDDEIRVISYQDFLNNPVYAQDSKHVLENIVTNSFYLNFTINLLPFNIIDQWAELRFIQFMSDEIIPTGKLPYQSIKVNRDYTIHDFLYQYQKDGKNPGVFLTMELDRETGTISKIYKEQTQMTAIVGSRKCLSLNNLPTIIRLNEVKSEEVNKINDIIDGFGQQNCCFALIWIYDQFKKKREPYRQFIVPFNKQNDTFGDIIESTKLKLEQMKRKQSNKLDLMNIESLKMWTIKYNNKFVIQKQRVFYLDDYDWRNPMLQYELNQLSKISVQNLCNEFPNQSNEMYQPYSVMANKNGQGWFHFVYLAAQMTFDEPKEQTAGAGGGKGKDTKRSSAGGFSLGNATAN